MDLYLSPFGMDECCICDGPVTHVIPTEDGELLPYCAGCASKVKAAFPDSRVLLYHRVPETPHESEEI